MSRSSSFFWLLAFALISSFIAANSTLRAIQDQLLAARLDCCGLTADARIVDRWQIKPVFDGYPITGLDLHVSYSFSAPDEIAEEDELVNSETYASASPGATLPVRYLQSDPSVSRLVGNAYRFPHMEMAFIWWMAFIPTVWSLFRRWPGPDA